MSLIFSYIFIENAGFGASPARTSVASFPAGGFFFNVTFEEAPDCFVIFPQFVLTNTLICHQIGEPPIKPASWTL